MKYLLKKWGTALILAGAIGCSAKDSSTRVTLDQLPEPVRSALDAQAANAKIDDIEKRIKDGETTYRAEVTSGSEKVLIRFAEDGRVMTTKKDDKDVDIDDLPVPVRATLEAELKGGTIEALEKSGDVPGTFEMVLKIEGKEHELRVDTEGKIVERKP